MKTFSLTTFGTAARNVAVAAAVTLVAGSAAIAENFNAGLQAFLDEPTDFVAIANGAPGSVTYASMVDGRLLVQFTIPSHGGDSFGEVFGNVDADGSFTGNGILIGENGEGRSASVTMVFQDDGTIIADVAGNQQGSGFMPKTAYYGL